MYFGFNVSLYLLMENILFNKLKEINSRPTLFEFYTAKELWTDEHTSQQMLEFHLNESINLSSRNKEFINRSVKWIVSHFGIDSTKSIIDFGCGPGLYTSLLAKSKADVTGVDFSKRSIEYARKDADQKKLSITYHQDDYLEFETDKKFDLVTMIFCDYCALSPEQRKSLLTKMYRFLKPGGKVLLDVYSLSHFASKNESASYDLNQLNRFWSSDDYYGFLNTFKYDEEKVTLDKYTIIEKERTRIVYNWLQHFSKETLMGEFEQCGFVVEEFYSDVAGSKFSIESNEIAIVAKK